MERILKQRTFSYIFAGLLALLVVHGLGRFSFTPMLPYLIHDHIISIEQGTFLASINYFGYLVGALLAIFLTQPKYLKPCLFSCLIINFISTCLQVYAYHYPTFILLRLINGLSNGIVFVLAPALILEWLVAHAQQRLSGFIYLGVSIGLIIDSILVDWLSIFFQGQNRWLPVAVLSIPLILISILILHHIPYQQYQQVSDAPQHALFNRQTMPLFIAYAGAGLGYILPMTFLPALAHQLIPQHPIICTNTWLITAISCLIFLPFWNHLGFKKDDRYALIWSYLIQSLGVLAILVFANMWGIILCAVFMGGSFMGTVVCSQRLAKYFQPHQGAKLFAVLITLYAGTQLLGPYFARIYMQHGGSLLNSFLFGLIALIWGALWMLKVPKPTV